MPPPELPSDSRQLSRPTAARELAPSNAVQDLSGWCADANRLLHVTRRHGADSPGALALRARLVADLVVHVQDHAPLDLAVTPRSIVLGEAPVFVAENANALTGVRALERELPWILHRDGVRALGFHRGLTGSEAAAWIDGLVAAAPASATHADLVTLVWDAGIEHLRLRTEESSAVYNDPLLVQRDTPAPRHVHDWPTPEAPAADAKRLWDDRAASAEAVTRLFAEAWANERDEPFASAVTGFVEDLFTVDSRPEMTEALAASIVTWVATAVQRCDWAEAMQACEQLRRADPTGEKSREALAYAFDSVDAEAVTERIDESDPREQSRLFAFVVRVGAPALPLLIKVLAGSNKSRVRAGATTALAYAFAEDPSPLGVWLAESRWHVVRNIVFVLGQIGGPGVVPLLATAARHVDQRVRRAAIHALGQVPAPLRRSVLITQLDTSDTRLLAAALAMLCREPDPAVTAALLAHVRAPEFEARLEEHKVALISALADMNDDATVPTLEAVLVRGNWFARRSAERTAAARALARLGSPAARTVLELGLRHRSEVVREACDEALASWGRA